MKFEDCLDIILEHEGGYVDHKDDPGGETKYGISKRAYPHLDIKRLTIEDAKVIYMKDYWLAGQINVIPLKMRLMHFDACVNHGPVMAVKLLQEALGVNADGVMGPETRRALAAQPVLSVLSKYAYARWRLYAKHPNYETFSKGWMKRLLDISTRGGQ